MIAFLRKRNQLDAAQMERFAETLLHILKRMERLTGGFERLAAAVAVTATERDFKNSGPDIVRRLDRIEPALNAISKRLEEMALDFARLEAEVTENGDAVQSVVTLLSTIAQEIRDSAGNQTKVTALADKLDAQTKLLAEAVAANTPADPDSTT